MQLILPEKSGYRVQDFSSWNRSITSPFRIPLLMSMGMSKTLSTSGAWKSLPLSKTSSWLLVSGTFMCLPLMTASTLPLLGPFFLNRDRYMLFFPLGLPVPTGACLCWATCWPAVLEAADDEACTLAPFSMAAPLSTVDFGVDAMLTYPPGLPSPWLSTSLMPPWANVMPLKFLLGASVCQPMVHFLAEAGLSTVVAETVTSKVL